MSDKAAFLAHVETTLAAIRDDGLFKRERLIGGPQAAAAAATYATLLFGLGAIPEGACLQPVGGGVDGIGPGAVAGGRHRPWWRTIVELTGRQHFLLRQE